jgi:lipopolysaccharide transport system ATP-binding protein
MKKAEIERKFGEIVEFSELEKFIETPLKHYSSGMYVRLAFAVAAHLDPDILLIDEVLSVGDLSFQRKCMQHAKRLQKRNATVLVVSHNMFSIKALCERVIYISQGRIRVDGSPAEAIDLYERESRLSIAPWAQRVVGGEQERQGIYVTDMQLLDESGHRRAVFDYGDRMRVRIWFNAVEKIVSPNFNVSFIRSDNVACCNYNTAMDGVTISSVFGEGSIELLTPPLKLTAELYTAHVMVWDVKFERLYSAQVGGTFHVRHDVLNTHFGVFHESAEWLGVPDGDKASRMKMSGGVER